MSMRIDTSTSLIAEPLFAKHTLTGKIEITQQHIDNILAEIQSMPLHRYNWGLSGWNDDNWEIWNMTPMIQRLANLIIHQVYDGIVNLYQLPSTGSSFVKDGKNFTFDVRRSFPLVISGRHDYPYNRHPSAFSTITWLKTSEGGHKVYVRNPLRGPFDEPMQFWNPEPKQHIIIPGHQDWGICSGNDSSDSVAIVTHIKVRSVNI